MAHLASVRSLNYTFYHSEDASCANKYDSKDEPIIVINRHIDEFNEPVIINKLFSLSHLKLAMKINRFPRLMAFDKDNFKSILQEPMLDTIWLLTEDKDQAYHEAFREAAGYFNGHV